MIKKGENKSILEGHSEARQIVLVGGVTVVDILLVEG
jgi:hypothetical protein